MIIISKDGKLIGGKDAFDNHFHGIENSGPISCN